MGKDNPIRHLKAIYNEKRQAIERRLEDFRRVWNKDDEKIFAELCFCIATPQSPALRCHEIITALEGNRLLFNGKPSELKPYLRKTRFYKNKSRYICKARAVFKNNGKLKIKEKIDCNNIEAARQWLVKNIKGIGYKEASHFLRNIGFGKDIAILDIHILRNLKRFRVIKEIPRAMTKSRYLEIEGKFKKFSKRINIPLSHLDLLFWSMQTGKIFK